MSQGAPKSTPARTDAWASEAQPLGVECHSGAGAPSSNEAMTRGWKTTVSSSLALAGRFGQEHPEFSSRVQIPIASL